MNNRDPTAPVIEGFDCSGLVNRYSFQCQPFYTEGDNGGTLLDGSTVHDVLAAKVRLSWTMNSLSAAQYAALTESLNSGESIDTVNALFWDPSCDSVRLAQCHVTRPEFQFAFDAGRMMSFAGPVLTLEEASPIARFRVTPPDKLSYKVSETLDLTGLSVTAYNKNNAASDITADCVITPAHGTLIENPGAFAISVSYEGFPLASFVANAEDATIVAGGDWWTLYDTGTLRIYCKGNMPNYRYYDEDYDDRGPWDWLRPSPYIGAVIFEDGVTSVGRYAFGDWEVSHSYPVYQVIISDSVKRIFNDAFSACYSLAAVTIGSGVTQIDSAAFRYARNGTLSSVTYRGTMAQWEKIAIGAYNNALTGAIIHCADGDIIPPPIIT